ncbi:AfsR/SARP family transcriptional regulator [Dactylosporangium matsuzakiense]|uniref:SARP family transcriptional regulator n=1 Tax=Dactylosporangium matsuzakiense TaxID=53360 RepID=A0A9W6NPN3_9ACTN|nr:BTAD domain-containing putative transcriptional regulator [Dactylosporangium matsuzakiense]UWZ41928.1 tetratricopeptide repeat protein [Dactylosporangium matsuzakiense]GLL04406.1 SARP family transcriptional regulator [Dactylosporangium matsuzakiense]
MQFRLLGAVEADIAGRPIKLGWRQERCLLALLLLENGHPIHNERLAELIWEGEPPPDPRAALQVVVARLRGHLNAADAAGHGVRLVTKGDSYALEAAPEQVDLARFKMLVARARTTEHPDRAAAFLRTALRLWRGPALADVAGPWLRRRVADPLDELRLAATEELMDVELAAGRHHERIAELTQLVAEHPLRERLRGQLMTALHREGRRVAALDSYDQLRRTLRDSFGLEPGAQLRELHARILRADTHPPAAVAAAAARAPVAPVAVPQPPMMTAARPPTPAELPADVAGFVGRTEELSRLDAMLPQSADGAGPVVVTAIAGTAGVGKTALAVHWAHRVAARFPDGQLYVNLHGYATCDRPVPAIEALGGLLRSLGVREDRVPDDLGSASALYRSMLAGRRVLLFLDNARSVEQVRPLLPAGQGCLVVITSRDRLTGLVAHDGARRITLDILPQAQARALLRDMLGADRIAAEPEATDELAAACAFLPLALRISAADLINHPLRSIAVHVAQMRGADPLAALTVDGERAVHNALELSYRTVTAEAQRLFRLLGLVPGDDFTAAAAAALAGVTGAEAAALLDRLAAAHLVVEAAPERFTFHDLLRSYARTRTGADDPAPERAAAARRLYDWYFATLDAAAGQLYPQLVRLPSAGVAAVAPFCGTAQALAWLEAERRNLVQLVRHAAADYYPEMAWRLADGMRGFLSQSGRLFDWFAVCRAGLATAEAGGDVNGQAAMLIGLASANQWVCRHDETVAALLGAIRLAEAGGWLEGTACARNNLGIVYDDLGRPDEALEQHNRATALAREHGSTRLLVPFLDSLGHHHYVSGQLTAAQECFDECLRMAETLQPSTRTTAYLLESLAGTYRALGRLRDAADTADRALALCRDVGNRLQETTILSLLAMIHAELGERECALDLAAQAVATARCLEGSYGTARALIALAMASRAVGLPQRAAELYAEAGTLLSEVGTAYHRAAASIGLAVALRDLGRLDAALQHANDALALTEQGRFRVLQAHAHATIAEIHLSRGDPVEARAAARRAAAAHRPTHSTAVEARIRALEEHISDGSPHAGRAPSAPHPPAP